MQQIMGVTPQRHSILEVIVPVRGPNQRRLPEEATAQEWRDDTLSLLAPPTLQILLPQGSSCVFWQEVSEYLSQFGNNRCLVNLPTVPMPYFSEEALLPLPPSPEAGFCTGLSLHPEVIDDVIQAEVDADPPPTQE